MSTWNDTPNWEPISSFVEPVGSPGVDPLSYPHVCLEWNPAWNPVIFGALFQLMQPTTWVDGPPPLDLLTAQQWVQSLMGAISEASVCAIARPEDGMDPSHPSQIDVALNADGLIYQLQLHAGRTSGSSPISWADTSLPIIATGTYSIVVDGSGTASIHAGGPPPLTVLLATVVIGDYTGLFTSQAIGNGFFSGDSSGQSLITTFPITDPISFPTPDVFNQDVFFNASTPVADYTGCFQEWDSNLNQARPMINWDGRPSPPIGFDTGLLALGMNYVVDDHLPPPGVTSPFIGLYTRPASVLTGLDNGAANLVGYVLGPNSSYVESFASGPSQYDAYRSDIGSLFDIGDYAAAGYNVPITITKNLGP